jgi:hypothetical protein
MDYSKDCGETAEQAFDDEANEAEYVRVGRCGTERGEYEECIAVRIGGSVSGRLEERNSRQGRNRKDAGHQRIVQEG